MNSKAMQADGKTAYLDILRIAAIYLVILLHAITPVHTRVDLYATRAWMGCNVLNGVARAGVPLFFMISGYLALNDPRTLNIAGFYKKRLLRILLPFFVWNTLYFIDNAANGTHGFSPLLYLSELFNNGSAYHLWFVYTLTGIYLVLPFLKRILDNCTCRQMLLLLFIILFPPTIRPLINTLTPANIFLCGPLFEGYLGFFLLGYMLGRYELKKWLRICLYCGGVIGFCMSVAGNYLMSSAESLNLFFNTGYSLTAYLVAAALFTAAKYAFQIKNEKTVKLLRNYSRLTYGIYFSHVLIQSGIGRFIPASFTPSVYVAVSFILTSFLSTALIFALSFIKPIRKFIT